MVSRAGFAPAHVLRRKIGLRLFYGFFMIRPCASSSGTCIWLLVQSSVPTIEVASRHEAGDILCSPQRCAEVIYLLSIGDVQDELPLGYENVERKLRLLVADVITEFGASEEDIQQIITLGEELRSTTGRVLIHCEAGVSRSSAAALIMYTCWLGPGREREAMTRVLAQRPIAVPNRRMVELADKLLDRKGNLVAALYEALW